MAKRIFLYTLLGACLTVVSSWTIAWATNTPEANYNFELVSPSRTWAATCFTSAGIRDCLLFPRPSNRTLDKRYTRIAWINVEELPSDADLVIIESYGWPFLAVSGSLYIYKDKTVGISGGWKFGTRLKTGSTEIPYLLPYRPVFWGFLADTLLYALLSFGIKRSILWQLSQSRGRRGHCLQCGYNLRHQHGQGCPECGWKHGHKGKESLNNRATDHVSDRARKRDRYAL